MAYLYIIQSERTGKYFVSSTHDLIRCLRQHESGEIPPTRGNGPWKLVFHAAYPSKHEAVQVEYRARAS